MSTNESATEDKARPGELRFAYDDGAVAYQRPCDTEGCEKGLLMAPARFDPRCGGSGYLVRWIPPLDGEA